jgi:hypothetical protein
VSAVLFGVGALVAVLLLPSRRQLAELQNPAQAASTTPAASSTLADSTTLADSLPTLEKLN